MSENRSKGYRGMAMEGSVARWYSKTRGTGSQLQAWRAQAAAIDRDLPAGATVLEVAPGPGYFAVELARSGRLRVAGLDISRTFVEIATRNAQREGVSVDFRLGNASHMPFPDRSFDLVVCQAAFKNFSQPQTAVDEMFRVVKSPGAAWIEDMRRDAPDDEIRGEVRDMELTRIRSWMTYRALRGLRRRAYLAGEFEDFAARSGFRGCAIALTRIGLEVRMTRREPGPSSR